MIDLDDDLSAQRSNWLINPFLLRNRNPYLLIIVWEIFYQIFNDIRISYLFLFTKSIRNLSGHTSSLGCESKKGVSSMPYDSYGEKEWKDFGFKGAVSALTINEFVDSIG